jgi:hypothetical protein
MNQSVQIDKHMYAVSGDAVVGREYKVSFVGCREVAEILAEEYEQNNDCHLQYIGPWHRGEEDND